ncbi:hypothetical protein Peur_065576 [Populus x canadensis]
MGLQLNSILGASKIAGSVSSLLFLVAADSGVTTGWVVCTAAAEFGVAAGGIFLVEFGIAASSTTTAEFRVETGSLFAVDFGVAAGSTTIVEFEVETGSLFAVDSGVAASSMVCTSLSLLRVMALAFSFGLISA